MKPNSLADILSWTEEQAREYLEKIRWYNRKTCPHCKSTNVKKLERKEGSKIRAGVHKCYSCRKQFTVTVGTIFEGSHIPLRKWIGAFYLLCSSKKGISANQLGRNLGVSYKTAWFMAHRIRYSMKSHELGRLTGIVEVDETYVGGKQPRWKGNKNSNKSAVVALVERDGRVRNKVVKRVTGRELKGLVYKNVHTESRVMTDDFKSYKGLGKKYTQHCVIKHSYGDYVDGDIHTNTVESYFSLIKRGIIGVYHQVSKKHLPRYCEEFAFRWNNRRYNDEKITQIAVKMSEGKKMTYKNRVKKYLDATTKRV